MRKYLYLIVQQRYWFMVNPKMETGKKSDQLLPFQGKTQREGLEISIPARARDGMKNHGSTHCGYATGWKLSLKR